MTAAVNVNQRSPSHPRGATGSAGAQLAPQGAASLPTPASAALQHVTASVIPDAALKLGAPQSERKSQGKSSPILMTASWLYM